MEGNNKFEEDKTMLFPQELIMKIQVERQEKPLKEQKALMEESRKAESHLLNKLVFADTFTRENTEYDNWEFANFYPGGIGTENNTEIRGNWMPANFQPVLHGLQLRSLILKSKPTLALKSLACEIKLAFRLIGDSTLCIITRGVGVKDPDAAVCKIKKEQDSQRVFLIFGGNVGMNNEFKFFKKQEFPEITDMAEEAVVQDFVDMKMTLIDNGDDRIFVSAAISNKRVVSMSCNKFIPTLRETSLMLAGSGDSVLLKNISARQIDRVDTVLKPTNHYECCTIL
ncbi:unnamed protein product [Blepharisma stoltei]|uniref:Uncharacterized protein n=1 Tax=Blepharisma stoltei TaxID=1481888 RepID=A0AAU9IZX6_9CILI|nr:unnamed protein product [Blepharisma stoltei]